MNTSIPLGPLLQAFFVDHLLRHKRVSAYRDTFRLLLGFLHTARGLAPATVGLADLDAAGPPRLPRPPGGGAAKHGPVPQRAPGCAAQLLPVRRPRQSRGLALATRVLAIPTKRRTRRVIGFLTRAEMDALLTALDRTAWAGRRDHALLLTLYNTGARVSELTMLRRAQVGLGPSPAIQLHGKGRKERVVPLWSRTARVLRGVVLGTRARPDGWAFPNTRRGPVTRHGLAYRLAQAVARARAACPNLETKRVSPHVIRHTTAMHLLQGGVDPATIALWLGHEDLETTHMYVEADLALKERALNSSARSAPAAAGSRPTTPFWPSWQPSDYVERHGCLGSSPAVLNIIRGPT